VGRALISGIRWVEELVGIAGGAPIFPELAGAALAKNRIRRSRRSGAARPGGDLGVLVRQKGPEGDHPLTPGMAGRARGA
jgi:hypothetical protein